MNRAESNFPFRTRSHWIYLRSWKNIKSCRSHFAGRFILSALLIICQPLLSTLSQQRSSHSHEGFSLLQSDEDSQSPLKNCTLVLIDRTIDLFTPTIHDPSPPLAHRVLCTLRKAKKSSLDISLTQPLTSVLYSKGGECPSDPMRMNSPLSAVSALPIQVTPSIAPPFLPDASSDTAATATDSFMSAMFAMSEESGKTILYDELRKTVVDSQGTLPPSKKRGIGAELLGLVNAILSTPSSSSTSLPYNEELCVDSSGLLSWCLALIDSLQRSSTKQLQSHFASFHDASPSPLLQCLSSYEMKSTRERVLLSSLTQQHQLSLLSYPVITEIILESCGLTTGSDGVVDLEHFFQMLLG